MKTLLVDAVDAFVIESEGIFKEMHGLLETYPNPKIILTGANDEQFKTFGLDTMPYEVFTLKHDPEKTNPAYFEKMLAHFGLKPEDVVYFEHDEKAVRSAKKNMIKAPMTRTGTIPCESYGKSASADVFLRPAAEGKGIIAGGAVRVVCDLAGYKNIVGKILSRSVNKLNNARATVEALRGAKMVSGRSGRVVSAAVTAEASEIVEPAGEEVKIDATNK